nr:unnamed protein product [Callosobruchus chinensis]
MRSREGQSDSLVARP